MIDKNVVGEAYKNGSIIKEIAKDMEVSEDSIRKCILRNFKHLKEEHEKNAKLELLNKIESLYRKGYTSLEIGDEVGLEASTVRSYTAIYFKHLKGEHKKNAKLELLNKIESLYRKGYVSSEIAREVGLEASTVRNYILSSFKHLKEDHEKNYKKRKDIIRDINRIINKELNGQMSTRGVVMQNIHSYDEKNGKYTFNSNSGARPFDLPKTYVFQA